MSTKVKKIPTSICILDSTVTSQKTIIIWKSFYPSHHKKGKKKKRKKGTIPKLSWISHFRVIPVPSWKCSAQLRKEMHSVRGSSCELISHLLWAPFLGPPTEIHPFPLQRGAICVCSPGWWGWPRPHCHTLYPRQWCCCWGCRRGRCKERGHSCMQAKSQCNHTP